MVLRLAIYALTDTPHIRDRLDLSGLDLHHDSRTRLGIDRLQFIDQRFLGYILYIDIDRGANIHAIHRVHLNHVRPASTDTANGTQPGLPPQERIVLQLQSILPLRSSTLLDLSVDITDRTRRQGPERFLALHHLLRIKTALITSQTKERELTDLLQVRIRDLPRVNRELAAFTAQPFQQISLIARRRTILQFTGKIKRQRVHPILLGRLERIQPIILGILSRSIRIRLKVDIHIITRHAGSHQLTVRRIDIATSGQHQTVRSFLALGHLHPFIPLHEGRIKGTEQDSYGHKPQQQHDHEVTE